MPLTLHLHPLSSFCHKVLIGLYENGTPFTPQMVSIEDGVASADFLKLSPFGKIPALEDSTRGMVVNETSVILEYLDTHYPGNVTLIPRDTDTMIAVRMWDRFLDSYLHQPMQRVVADGFRPAGKNDPLGVEEARASMRRALDHLEQHLADVPFAGGADFSLADCAAAPALFYAQAIVPFAESHPRIARYFDALVERPSYARVLDEARPFMQYFPLAADLPPRFRP